MSRTALFLLLLLRVTPSHGGDWIDDVDPRQSMAPLWPADAAAVRQTPPDFHWPAPAERLRYTVTLTDADGGTQQVETPHNWLNWPDELPPGEYRWRVTAARDDESVTSRERRFRVRSDATAFVVPPMGDVLQRAVNAPRPRSLPGRRELERALGAGRNGVDLLLGRVRDEKPLLTPVAGSVPADAALNDEVRRTREAMFAYVATRRPEDRRLALERLRNMVNWDPNGATAYRHNDQAARGIAANLVLGYDWLYDELDQAARQQLLEVLEVRLAHMHRDLFTAGERLSRFPLDSHRNHTLSMFAAFCLVLAGDLEPAAAWLEEALPMALHWTSPWGEESGGFANGSAYALWINGDLLLAWNLYRRIAGIDVADKAWVRNFGRYLAWFLPPGAPAGAFGDAAERPLLEQRARVARAYERFAPGDLMRWYAPQLDGEDYSRLDLLLAPAGRATQGPLPAGTADAALFEDIGQVAMHSSLADPKRVSVLFRSSPYGSFNHGHADQNSFVIHAGGKPLAIDSGYFDDYGSPHWRNWYKQTRAHNAITYDGGRGQSVYELDQRTGSGRIVDFEHNPGWDRVTGDAAAAYGGDIDVANRTLVYLRPDLLFVHDRMQAGNPHHWEWNLHSNERFRDLDDAPGYETGSNPALCVRVLDGPETVFAQENRFTVPPRGIDAAPQWHARWSTKAASRQLDMLVLLSPGCASTDVLVEPRADGTTVRVRGMTLSFGEGVEVRHTQEE